MTAVADSFFPRTFYFAKTLRMGATVSLSVNLFASEADYAQAGADLLLAEADSDCVRGRTYDQTGRIWSRTGRLLAVTRQMAVFR